MQDDKSSVSDTKDPVDQTVDDSQEQKDTVKYDTFKKLLGEKKNLQLRYEEAQAKLKEAEEVKLKETGQFKELFESEKKKTIELQDSLKSTEAKFAYRIISSQVEAHAAKSGCVDAKALLELYRQDLADLEPDENFNISQDKVNALIEKAMKERAYLFQKQAPKVNSVMPNHSAPTSTQKVDPKANMKRLAELLAAQHKQGS